MKRFYLIGVSILLVANSTLAFQSSTPTYKYKAHSFKNWQSLTPTQAGLLETFLSKTSSPRGTHRESFAGLTTTPIWPMPPMPVQDWNQAWQLWNAPYDDLAASFLAVTHALDNMYLDMGDGTFFRSSELIKKINGLKGDRIFVEIDKEKFARWIAASSKFKMTLAKSKEETGQFKFAAGDQLGGSLHPGYEIQGFSSVRKVPRIQINYRYSDSEADIDLDGYSPFLGGFLPNPQHLTYENSDPRYWFSKYNEKFGDPGFQVKSLGK